MTTSRGEKRQRDSEIGKGTAITRWLDVIESDMKRVGVENAGDRVESTLRTKMTDSKHLGEKAKGKKIYNTNFIFDLFFTVFTVNKSNQYVYRHKSSNNNQFRTNTSVR